MTYPVGVSGLVDTDCDFHSTEALTAASMSAIGQAVAASSSSYEDPLASSLADIGGVGGVTLIPL